jgi:hypothetical protein
MHIYIKKYVIKEVEREFLKLCKFWVLLLSDVISNQEEKPVFAGR